MFKYLILVLLLITGALGFMYFYVGVPRVYEEGFLASGGTPHLYANPAVSISNIEIRTFYFVPKNKKPREGWNELLGEALKKLSAFHMLQLQGRSLASYGIHSEAVIGEENNLFYDTDVTRHGNPKALISVSNELEARGFLKSDNKNTYRVALIMYEGVGASGGSIYESGREDKGEVSRKLNIQESDIYEINVKSVDGLALFSSTYLAGEKYKNTGVAILAHEFYHTLGLPDEYDLNTAIAVSDDLMGLGRERPLENAYIRKESLIKLGL